MERIHILIADDHPLFRDGLRVLLESVPDMQVLGEATTGDEVLAQAASLQPDLILMDIKMPSLNGIEATRRILHTSPHIRILILMSHSLTSNEERTFLLPPPVSLVSGKRLCACRWWPRRSRWATSCLEHERLASL